MADFETRAVARFETRAEADGTVTIEGCASTTGAPYEVWDFLGSYTETIAPGAFRSVLGGDTVLLVNHDGMPLARSRSGTLTLSEDDEGLQMRATLDPSNPDAGSLISAMERGDLDQMSFAFTVARQEWNGDYTERTISDIAELHDVSVVTWPANPGTHASLTSRAMFAARSLHHLRQGRVLSEENLQALQDVLASLGQIDECSDDAQAQLQQVIDAEQGGGDSDDGDDSDAPEDDGVTGTNSLAFFGAKRALYAARGRFFDAA